MWADEQDVQRSDRATIVLIGLRAAGKSEVGRAAAEAANVAFIDLDDVVQAAFPEDTVREIWDTHGETAWRTVEAIACDAVFDLASPPGVLALGGGAPMVSEIANRLEAEKSKGRAIVVYLQCGTDTLRARLGAEPGDRPSLTGDDLADETETVRARREPTFLGLADAVVEADDDVETVVRLVLAEAYGP